MSRLELALDPTRCQGHGFCHEAAPRVIDLDEWGYPLLRGGTLRCPIGAGELDAVRRAVSVCPHGALKLLTCP